MVDINKKTFGERLSVVETYAQIGSPALKTVDDKIDTLTIRVDSHELKIDSSLKSIKGIALDVRESAKAHNHIVNWVRKTFWLLAGFASAHLASLVLDEDILKYLITILIKM